MHLKNAHQEEETGSDDYELWGMGGYNSFSGML